MGSPEAQVNIFFKKNQVSSAFFREIGERNSKAHETPWDLALLLKMRRDISDFITAFISGEGIESQRRLNLPLR